MLWLVRFQLRIQFCSCVISGEFTYSYVPFALDAVADYFFTTQEGSSFSPIYLFVNKVQVRALGLGMILSDDQH